MVKINESDPDCDNVSLVDSLLGRFGISKLWQGRERDFTQSFYNSIILIVIVLCTTTIVFTILQPFIKPLLWAVLCGSVLHPFKFGLSSCFKRWLRNLEISSKPLSVEIASIPVFVLAYLSEFIGSIFISKLSAICFTLSISAYLLNNVYNYTPNICFAVFWKLLAIMEVLLYCVMDLFRNSAIVIVTVIFFLSAITLLWDSEKNNLFVIASYVTWISLACYVVGFFGYLRFPLFFLLMSGCGIGLAYDCWLAKTRSTEKGSPVKRSLSAGDCGQEPTEAVVDDKSKPYSEIVDDLVGGSERPTHFEIGAKVSSLDKAKYRSAVFKTQRQDSRSSKESFVDSDSLCNVHLTNLSKMLNNPHTSDLFIYIICTGCGVIVIVKNLWLLYLIAFLFVVHLAKLFCIGFGIWLFVQEFWGRCTRQLNVWYSSRSDVLIPPPVAAFFKVSGITKMFILGYLKDYCDAFASVTVILALLAATIFVSTFLCIQIYAEVFYMVKVSGQIINQTVVHNPELTQLLPEGWESQLDSVLNSAYTYGREMLSKTLSRMLKDIPEMKAKELEQTALELWDRVYQAWVLSSLEQTIGPKVTTTAVFETWTQFIDGVQKTPGLINLSKCNALVVENMAMLNAGLDSVWVIVKGNASLLLQAVSTMLSVVLSHGAALFGFFINMIIYLTALYYLLSSSRVLYKPVEILTNILPQYGNKLAVAMETASKEVIVASFKLCVFYGLWTWFIHNIFLMNITYLPSVLAAILAVVPVLGTYWACLPGVLDLWLAQGKGIHALSLAICQFLPTTIVDTTIYNDIHGGHPYLTGLAVAGGVLCLGIEGAIVGPLALCGLLVIINLSSVFLRDSSSPLS